MRLFYLFFLVTLLSWGPLRATQILKTGKRNRCVMSDSAFLADMAWPGWQR